MAPTVPEILDDFLVYAEATKRAYKHDAARANRLQDRFGTRLAADVTTRDVETSLTTNP